jgi:tetratricopeptide (TPR) repeat protein
MRRNGLELFIIVAVAALAMAALRQDSPPPEAESEPLHHYMRGVALARQAEHRKAIAEFSAALALNPEYLKSYWARGRSWLAEGSRERALADYNSGLAHARGPMDDWIHESTIQRLHADRARLYLVQERYEMALADATEADNYDVKGCALAGLGRWEEAEIGLEFQRIYMGFVDDNWGSLVHLERVYTKLGNTEKALNARIDWEEHGSPSPHGPEGPCFLCR